LTVRARRQKKHVCAQDRKANGYYPRRRQVFDLHRARRRLRMNRLFRWLSTVLVVFLTPALANADPVQITSGYFVLARPLIGPEAVRAFIVWENLPAELFGSSPPPYVFSTWDPGEYSSTLLGTTAPVEPLHPGTAPVGGTFTASNAAFQFNGGDFLIPPVFPPTDEEGLYTVRQPFTMTGHWTVDVALGDGTTARFDRDLAGRGTARLILGADPASGNSILSMVVYDFKPVPEPATILLLGAGAAALGARRYRR
jgi:hypothetical protein